MNNRGPGQNSCIIELDLPEPKPPAATFTYKPPKTPGADPSPLTVNVNYEYDYEAGVGDGSGGGDDQLVTLPEEFWTLITAGPGPISMDDPLTEIESQITLTSSGSSGATTAVKAPICPFFHRIHFSFYEKAKIAFGTVFIAPLRTLGMLTCISLAWCLTYVATVGLTSQDLQERPLSAWRRRVRVFISRVIMRAFLFCSSFQWISIKGQQATAAEAPILVGSPHSSFFDALSVIILGTPSVVARKSTQTDLFIGQLLETVQAIYVTREDADSRAKSIQSILDRVVKIQADPEEWSQIYMFPEGTTANRSCICKFKAGAFLPAVPVQPVLIKYPNQLDTMSWTFDGLPFLHLLWFSLCQFTSHVELEFLPVYHPSAAEKADAHLYAENVRELMAQKLGIPTVDHTYEDGIVMVGLDKGSILAKLKGVFELRKALGISALVEVSVIRAITTRARSDFMARKEKFVVDFALGAPDPLLLDRLYECFEKGPDGTIDERNYLVNAVLLNPFLQVKLVLPPIFLMYTQGRRRMSRNEFSHFLKSILYQPNEEAWAVFKLPADETIDLEEFTKKTLKNLEYIKLYCLEMAGLLNEYPARDREINECRRKSKSN